MLMNVATVDKQTLVRLGRAVSERSGKVVAERSAPVCKAAPASYVQRYNVLIASPSDAERNLVFQTIAAWNGCTGSADRKVVFVPLMWEKHATSNAKKRPQESINEQLLSRADLILAVFNSRLGTATEDYPAGTVEELERGRGRAAVFFLDGPRLDRRAPDGLEQLNKLVAFQKNFKGFAKMYTDGDDLADFVRDQLDGWSSELYEEDDRVPLIARPGSWNFDNIESLVGQNDGPMSLLIFNSELASFRSPEAFEQHWRFLDAYPRIKRVAFLLPEYKVERLRRCLLELKSSVPDNLLRRFHVCPRKELTTPSSGRDRVSSSLAFVLACRNDGLDLRDCLPAADLAILSEPFSSAGNYHDGDVDIQWDYNYYLSVSDETILTTLRRIWREQFDESRQVPILKLLEKRAASTDADRALDEHYKKASVELYEHRNKVSVEISRGAETFQLIQQLRAKLFDPNVPSYLLNGAFELLDWNAAFELIFPTDKFYRNMRVKKLIDRLDNSEEVKERGLHVVKESTAPVDMEKLQYTSPVYGVMEFTKIASKLPEPVAQGNNGWIVALNVDKVEYLTVYENDLKHTNEEQFLVSQYARPADRLLGGFPGYTAIVDAHVQAMTQAGAHRILDLGCGPGFLAKKLLEAQLSVTSVDHNDLMIEIARERCGDPDDFTMVKANVETLHSPDDFYDVTKIGIAPPYDGACMLDLYQWLRDPRALLRRLVQEKLLSPGARVTVSLPCGRDLLRAINSQAASRREPKDFEYFSNLMSYVIDHKPSLSGDAVAEDLKVTGYRIVEKGQIPYAIGRQKFDGFPFLVAEAPHG